MNKKILALMIVLFSLNSVFSADSIIVDGDYPDGCGCSIFGPITGWCGTAGFNAVSSITSYCGGCLGGWTEWVNWDCNGVVEETRSVCWYNLGCLYHDWSMSSWRDGDCGLFQDPINDPWLEGQCADERHETCCYHCSRYSCCDGFSLVPCSCSGEYCDKCGSYDCDWEHKVWIDDEYGCGSCPYSYGPITQWRCKYYETLATPTGYFTCNCQDGFQDCNGDNADGCEINELTGIIYLGDSKTYNCGSCGNTCQSDEWCHLGSCEKIRDHMRYFRGGCTVTAENCDLSFFTPLHGSPASTQSCDNWFTPPKCWCSSVWGNCNANEGDGCESPIMKNNNACGTSCTDCGDAACVNGQCQDPDLWAHCKFECSCGILAEDYVMEGGTNTFAGKYCNTGETGDCSLYNTDDVDYDFYRPITYLVSEGCQANDDMLMCNVNAEDAWCRCDFNHLDCNNGWDGCETHIADQRHCGSCANDCADIGCSGSEYLDIDKNDAGFFDVCNFTCTGGNCRGYTLNAGYCESNADCEYRLNLKCWDDVKQEGLYDKWCCEDRECGHAGQCYAEYDQLNFPEPDGERLYVCIYHEDKMQWVDFGLKFNLGRMIQYLGDYSVSELVDNTYFSHAGLTTTCDETAYRECTTSEPHYSWQYCSSISAVFDGMFNLETGNNVPVLVSEQRLYDPYSPARPIVKLQDCGLDNRDYQRLKC